MNSEILIMLLFLASGPLILFMFYVYRKQKVEHIQPKDALIYDIVRWGKVGTLSLLKMGVLALYKNEVVLYDKNNLEVFRYRLSNLKVSFVSTKMGMHLMHGNEDYDIRIDYGSAPSYVYVSKRYELWAEHIKQNGGKHFIEEQDAVAKAVFNPKTNRIYFTLGLIVFLLLMAITVYDVFS